MLHGKQRSSKYQFYFYSVWFDPTWTLPYSVHWWLLFLITLNYMYVCMYACNHLYIMYVIILNYSNLFCSIWGTLNWQSFLCLLELDISLKPDEGYYRNVLCTLILTSTFLLQPLQVYSIWNRIRGNSRRQDRTNNQKTDSLGRETI